MARRRGCVRPTPRPALNPQPSDARRVLAMRTLRSPAPAGLTMGLRWVGSSDGDAASLPESFSPPPGKVETPGEQRHRHIKILRACGWIIQKDQRSSWILLPPRNHSRIVPFISWMLMGLGANCDLQVRVPRPSTARGGAPFTRTRRTCMLLLAEPFPRTPRRRRVARRPAARTPPATWRSDGRGEGADCVR